MIFAHRDARLLDNLRNTYVIESSIAKELVNKNLIVYLSYELVKFQSIAGLFPSKIDASVFDHHISSQFITDKERFIVDTYMELNDDLKKRFADAFVDRVRTNSTKKVFDSLFDGILPGISHQCTHGTLGSRSALELVGSSELDEICSIDYFDRLKSITFADACRICCCCTFKHLVDTGRFFLPSIRPLFLARRYNIEPIADPVGTIGDPINTVKYPVEYIPYMLAFHARESLFRQAMDAEMYDLAEAIVFRYIGSLPEGYIRELQGKTKGYEILMAMKNYLDSRVV